MFEFSVFVGDMDDANAHFWIVEARGAQPRARSQKQTRGHPDVSAILIQADLAAAPTPGSKPAVNQDR